MGKVNRRVETTLTLEVAVPYGGVEGGQLRELVFYSPRGATFETIERAGDGPVSFPLLNDLTEIPIPVLRLLGFEDAVLAAAMAAEVLEKKYTATAARAAALGISLPGLPKIKAGLEDEEEAPSQDEEE